VLVLKKECAQTGYFQYTIHYEGKSFSCPRTQKGFTSDYMHFSSFKIYSQKNFSVSHFTSLSLLRPLPKSYFKICTFHPNVLCFSSFNVQITKTCKGLGSLLSSALPILKKNIYKEIQNITMFSKYNLFTVHKWILTTQKVSCIKNHF